jgi:phosphatidylserine/phosphatidylglycerophosphate/cardiolipin synthase-like enzyme
MSAFTRSAAVRIGDRDYYDIMLASVEAASRRVWASLFIYDIRPGRDLEGQVLDLTAALIRRRRLGVDVRVLTTGHVVTPDISVANLASGLYLKGAGVPHRRLFASDGGRLGSHAKFVVCDDEAIVGSQNWADDAFRLNIEDAVLLRGNVVELIGQEFLRLWGLGKGMPRHAA